jgi:hypothetical protein
MAFQTTALPVLPGVTSQTTANPSLGSLEDLYPETFGGVRSYYFCHFKSHDSIHDQLHILLVVLILYVSQDREHTWDAPVKSPNSTLYLQVPLGAVIYWDDATKQRLLFENFVFSEQTKGNLDFRPNVYFVVKF